MKWLLLNFLGSLVRQLLADQLLDLPHIHSTLELQLETLLIAIVGLIVYSILKLDILDDDALGK